MLKKIIQIVKKIFFAVFLIYSYNIVAVPLGIIVPLNLFTIIYVTIFDVPALLSLIVLIFYIF